MVGSLYLSNDLSLIDSGLLKLGDNNELQIQHAGSNNFIEGGSGFSGNLFLRAKLNQEGVKIESDGVISVVVISVCLNLEYSSIRGVNYKSFNFQNKSSNVL